MAKLRYRIYPIRLNYTDPHKEKFIKFLSGNRALVCRVVHFSNLELKPEDQFTSENLMKGYNKIYNRDTDFF